MKLLDYIKGRRHGHEAQRIELEAMRDPLLGDAMSGYDKVKGGHGEALERLEARIAERAAAASANAPAQKADGLKQRRMRRWSVAAAAAVIASITGGTILYLQKESDPNRNSLLVAHEAQKKTEPYLDVILPPVKVIKDTVDVNADAESEKMKQRRVAAEDTPVIVPDFITVISNDAKDTADLEEFDMSNFTDLDVPVLAYAVAEEETTEDIPAYIPEPTAADGGIVSALQGRVAGVQVRGKASKTRISERRTVSGQVRDAQTGEPLPGATVAVEGTNTGAVTDIDGNFILSADDNARILAQFIGYESETVAADTSDHMLIAMVPDNTSLDEVVVIAYGTQKRSARTGSAQKARIPADDVMSAEFRQHMASEAGKAGIEGSATLEFEVNKLGRPYRIKTEESTSRETENEAKRILREGPDWEPAEGKFVITIEFTE